MTIIAAAVLALAGALLGGCWHELVHAARSGRARWALRRPHCPACGSALTGHRRMPLVWATGPRLCGRCGAQLGWQRFWLEAITGAVCAGIAWWLGWSWELPAFEILALACVALAGIDLATHRLPDHLLVQVGAAFGSLLLLAAAAGGQWADLARAACGGLLAFALYLVLALTGGLGMGDVKLASLLGTSLAWLGWDVWLVGVAAAPVFAALWVAVVGQARPRVGSAIAFAPFMTAAALVGILAGSQLVGWYAALQVG